MEDRRIHGREIIVIRLLVFRDQPKLSLRNGRVGTMKCHMLTADTLISNKSVLTRKTV